MKKWIFVFLFGWLTSCGQFSKQEMDPTIARELTFPHIVVLPHHGLTGKRIDQFYEQLAQKDPQYDRIVIISPDHFASLSRDVESSPWWLQQACFHNACIPVVSFGDYNFASSRIFDVNGKTIEHGIGEHFFRIAKLFPNVSVTPILLRRGNNASLSDKELLQQLIDLAKKEKILVIASVDFSHHVAEEFAKFHDQKAIADLDSDGNIFGAEVDCKNCLWITRSLAHHFGQMRFVLFDRTSVDSILETNSGYDNTSHVLWFFSPSSKDEIPSSSRKYVLFLSDKSFDSSIIARLYQQWQRKNNPKHFVHRLTHGFDDVFVLGDVHKDIFKYSLFDARKATSELLLQYEIALAQYDDKVRLERKGMIQDVHIDENMAIVCEISENQFHCVNIKTAS